MGKNGNIKKEQKNIKSSSFWALIFTERQLGLAVLASEPGFRTGIPFD
jgi:hypothetical protein